MTDPGSIAAEELTRKWLPVVWSLALASVLAVPFSTVPWSLIDLTTSFGRADVWSWERTFAEAFGAGVEYRPLFVLLTKLSYEVAGLHLWFYKAVVLGQFIAILLILVRLFSPGTTRRVVAACLALTCVVALHSSRVLFMFVPLNTHSLVLLLTLLTALAVIEEWGRGVLALFLFLTCLSALLLLESGVLIVSIVLAFWFFRVPSTSWLHAAAVVGALAVYAIVRHSSGTGIALDVAYTQTGLGFSILDADELRDTFKNTPALFWAYNVTATLLTVVLSEPRNGRFAFIQSWTFGDLAAWQWIHILSSSATTLLMIWMLAAWRRFTPRDRRLVVLGLVLVICGSGLGFLYTRDRIALSAGVGYGILVYVATAAFLERFAERKQRQALAACAVAVLAAAWLIRTGEAVAILRDSAWEAYEEWTTRYDALDGSARAPEPILEELRRTVVAHTPADPRSDPRWAFRLFERQYVRIE